MSRTASRGNSRTTSRGRRWNFTYYLVGFPETAADCEPWVRQVLGKTPTKADVLELREITAAFFGVAPQIASVKRLAQQQVWYNPQSKLRESELSGPRRAVLARLTTIADGQKNAPGSPVRTAPPPTAQEPGLRDTLKGHAYQVTAVAFSADGKTLASASCDRRPQDSGTRRPAKTPRPSTDIPTPSWPSPSAATARPLASADWNGTIKLWDAATQQEHRHHQRA